MRVLFLARHFSYLRLFESAIAELAERGHAIHLSTDREESLGGAGLVERLAARYGVVARIVTSPHDAHRQDPHLPMRYDTGRPRAVIRLRISQPRTTSLPCPAGLRARGPSPMMDLYRKNVFSTRP